PIKEGIMAITEKPGTTTGDQAAGWLTPGEFSILEAVCETLHPSLEPPVESSKAVAAYYRRSAKDLHVAMLVAETLSQENEQAKREKYLNAMANSPIGQLRQGYQAIKRLATFVYFSVPDAEGVNPNWEVLDYAAPAPPPVDAPQPIQPVPITGDTTLEADVVV